MSTILVTGGTGFIGASLSEHLAKNNKVYVTGHPRENPCLNCENLGHSFIGLPLKKLGIEKIFHLASCTDTMIHDRDYMMTVNLEWSRKLFIEAMLAGVKTIVYSSSAAVYGGSDGTRPFVETDEMRPLNVYGESKAKLDDFVLQWNPSIRIVGLRYTNVYGGISESHKGRCASMVWQLYEKMKKGPPTLFKWGQQARDFVHVNDVVTANVLASEWPNGVYNIGSGVLKSFNIIVKTINNILGTTWKIEYINNPFQQYYQDFNPVNIDKARSLGYDPSLQLEAGIRSFQPYSSLEHQDKSLPT